MASELEIFNPVSGEIIDCRDIQKIAQAISSLRTLKQQLNEVLDELTNAVVEESRRVGAKTINVGKTSVELSPEYDVQWDVEILSELLEQSGLPQERWEQLVQMTVSYKVDGRVAKQLASSNPKYAEVIERAQSKTPKKQYVKLKRV